MRQHTDTAQSPTRRLKKRFDAAGTAVGTALALPIDPPYNFGGPEVAMGITGSDGILSFLLDSGATADTDVTIWLWSALWKLARPSSKGWYKLGESTSLNTKAILLGALASFKVQEKVRFFLEAEDNTVVECLVNGDSPDQLADNDSAAPIKYTDLSNTPGAN